MKKWLHFVIHGIIITNCKVALIMNLDKALILITLISVENSSVYLLVNNIFFCVLI